MSSNPDPQPTGPAPPNHHWGAVMGSQGWCWGWIENYEKTQPATDPSCLTCRHSEPGELDDLILECRRYPPTITLNADDETVVAFPQVVEGDWCGEWAEQPTETM